MARNRPSFERDDETFPDEARYRLKRGPAVAWYIWGWETEPDEDTGMEVRTGRILATMVGDDRRESFDPEDFEVIGELDYCASCGQIGCTHDARERD